MKAIKIVSIILATSIILCGCSIANQEKENPSEEIAVSKTVDDIISVDDMFTDRDINYDYSDKDIYNISLADNKSKSDSASVQINGNNITIKSEGVYILRGKLSNGQIIIDANDNDKIQLVLNSVSINCDNSASIYCKNAKKLFITTIGDSTLTNKNDFQNDDENINGVVYSKSNLTLNGNKKLTINAVYGNAIVSNDDLAISSGEYNLTSEKHTLKANDSVRIANATLSLNATKDAIHCKNEEIEKGFVYIESGSIKISAEDDGIQASSAIKISGGTIDISKSNEGIEGRFIDLAGGDINIVSSDDGINATDKSQNDTSNEYGDSAPSTIPSEDNQAGQDMPTPPNMDNQEKPKDMPNKDIQNSDGKIQNQKGNFGGFKNSSSDCSLTISGGKISINANGDGLDSNGIIKISGGEIIVYSAENNGNSAVDYETQATITGGSIIAIGMSGMAEGFSNSSTQYSILYNLNAVGSADDKIELLNGNNSIISATAIKKYNSVLISTPDIAKGKYTLVAGNSEESIKVKNVTCSNSSNLSSGMKGKQNREFQQNERERPNQAA